jgi:hypothetical protein
MPALLHPFQPLLAAIVVGHLPAQFAGTQELAAMGPASIIFAFSQYIFQALQIAAVR